MKCNALGGLSLIPNRERCPIHTNAMQENDIVDDYARHEELYRKRLALLRESLEFVEQRRRLRRERFSSPDFKHIILRLKQNQTDAHAVKGKNQHLLHMVEDMLTQKQGQRYKGQR